MGCLLFRRMLLHPARVALLYQRSGLKYEPPKKALGDMTEHTLKNAKSALERLLAEKREADIQSRLREVLETVTGLSWIMEYPIPGGGKVDLACPAKRTVVEVKGLEECGPDKPGSKAGETQKGQVLRYLKGLSSSEKADLLSAGNNNAPWTGWLTNGRAWWGWTLKENGVAVPVPGTETGRFLWTPQEVSVWIRSKIRRDTEDQRLLMPVPTDLTSLHLEPFSRALLAAAERQGNSVGYRTKQAVWAKALRGAGMVPPDDDKERRDRLFANHTTLLLAARVIVSTLHFLDGDSVHDALPADVSDGLPAWVNADEKALGEVHNLARTLSMYDWKGSAQDHLRDAYHSLIERTQRKEFGEYYTPDWLAERVVQETLDEAWLDSAVVEALKGRSDGPAVLDPSCGSGTFLFHAARRIRERMAETHPSISPRDARAVVIRLVKGIDVHPIAVELAKATLGTALPPGPGEPEIILGDALQTAISGEETMWTNKEAVEYLSPGGSTIRVPREILEHDPMRLDMIRELNARAKTGYRGGAWSSGPPRLHHRLEEMQEQLEKVIEAEGDDIWGWHLSQISGLLSLMQRKVDRIVTNPPWIVVNDTPEGDRKVRLAQLQDWLGVQVIPPGSSAKGDLACLFTARTTELYLRIGGRMGMVLPGSALMAQTWERWRKGKWGPGVHMDMQHAEDLSDHDPVPFPHAPNGTSVVYASREADKGTTKDRRLPVPTGTPAWASSEYVKRVLRGACSQPHGLLYVDNANMLATETRGVVEITTKTSTKGHWAGLRLHGRVERSALRPVVTSRDVQPFCYRGNGRHIIAPTENRLGNVQIRWKSRLPEKDSRFPFTLLYWKEAESEYQKRRAPTAGKTLLDNLDWQGTLTAQLNVIPIDRVVRTPLKLVVNKSGKNGLRAARVPLNHIADDMLYYVVCGSEEEALYLCAILNAPCMQNTWNLTKTAALHYDKNPWRKVPVKRFAASNRIHVALVGVAREAEKNGFSGAVVVKLDNLVADLLPDHSNL